MRRSRLAAVGAGFALTQIVACGALPPALKRYAGRIEPTDDRRHRVWRGGTGHAGDPRRRFQLHADRRACSTSPDTWPPDGTLTGRLTTQGADRKPFTMVLAGRLGADGVQGTYTTPRCRFTVSLKAR